MIQLLLHRPQPLPRLMPLPQQGVVTSLRLRQFPADLRQDIEFLLEPHLPVCFGFQQRFPAADGFLGALLGLFFLKDTPLRLPQPAMLPLVLCKFREPLPYPSMMLSIIPQIRDPGFNLLQSGSFRQGKIMPLQPLFNRDKLVLDLNHIESGLLDLQEFPFQGG